MVPSIVLASSDELAVREFGFDANFVRRLNDVMRSRYNN
jgi:hypothetical protein